MLDEEDLLVVADVFRQLQEEVGLSAEEEIILEKLEEAGF